MSDLSESQLGYDIHTVPREVDDSVRRSMVRGLLSGGLVQVSELALNPMLPLGDDNDSLDFLLERFMNPHSLIIDEICLGPPQLEQVNPGHTGIWALLGGYTLETVPKQVPLKQQVAIARNLVGRQFTPYRRTQGNSGHGDLTVDRLSRHAYPQGHELDEFRNAVDRRITIPGPVIRVDVVSEVIVSPGDVVGFWTEDNSDSAQEKLAKLQSILGIEE